MTRVRAKIIIDRPRLSLRAHTRASSINQTHPHARARIKLVHLRGRLCAWNHVTGVCDCDFPRNRRVCQKFASGGFAKPDRARLFSMIPSSARDSRLVRSFMPRRFSFVRGNDVAVVVVMMMIQ